MDFPGLFRSTLPRGSDLRIRPRRTVDVAVSIHAPARERPYPVAASVCCSWSFDPRSREGATAVFAAHPHDHLFRSTLPRGSDRWECADQIRACAVSIHAPARERPELGALDVLVVECFDPRSREGATTCRACLVHHSDGFDPRSREGATQRVHKFAMFAGVSIHAPARERRRTAVAAIDMPLFRSTLPRGSDSCEPLLGPVDLRFRSTLPRGSDGFGAKDTRLRRGFDPRSREGATRMGFSGLSGVNVSIHAPARERPLFAGTMSIAFNVSIHAPARERQLSAAVVRILQRFRSTLPRGSDNH